MCFSTSNNDNENIIFANIHAKLEIKTQLNVVIGFDKRIGNVLRKTWIYNLHNHNAHYVNEFFHKYYKFS